MMRSCCRAESRTTCTSAPDCWWPCGRADTAPDISPAPGTAAPCHAPATIAGQGDGSTAVGIRNVTRRLLGEGDEWKITEGNGGWKEREVNGGKTPPRKHVVKMKEQKKAFYPNKYYIIIGDCR